VAAVSIRAVPTEKRQRQKQGRQARLQAKRKAQKRRQLLRRGAIVVIVAGVVVGSVLLFTSHSGPTGTTTTTVPVRQVTTAEIAATNTLNARMRAVATQQEFLTPAQRSAAQSRANAVAVAAGCPPSPATRVNTLSWKSAPKMAISTSAHYRAVVKTTVGTFTIALLAKTAPVTVNNFVFLARHGFYKCVIFHRVIPLFMNQSGDPTGTGGGSPGYTIPDENPEKASNAAYQYPAAGVAMANSSTPNTGGSQFFIITGTQGEGLANTYALFGQVISGINVIATINGQGNSSQAANGTPPLVTQRILSVTIVS
jgi:cyclophilin family peptidyl-prolyl cis-trans isomerase